MVEDDKHFPFYCIECFADSSQDYICKKILGYDKETGIPIVALTYEECEYLSKSVANKEKKDI